jgi:gamma-glutamyltranspeptidase
VSSDIVSILNQLGHEAEESKTMGSTQSIHIIDNIRYGYADLRRPNSGVAIQID